MGAPFVVTAGVVALALSTRAKLIDIVRKQVLVPSIITISFIDCLKFQRVLVVLVDLCNFRELIVGNSGKVCA